MNVGRQAGRFGRVYHPLAEDATRKDWHDQTGYTAYRNNTGLPGLEYDERGDIEGYGIPEE